MNDSMQTNPADLILKQAGQVKTNQLRHQPAPAPDRTSHLFGGTPTVVPTEGTPPKQDLSWMNGVAPAPPPAPVKDALGNVITPAPTITPPNQPAPTAPAKLNLGFDIEKVQTSMGNHINTALSMESVSATYGELIKDGVLAMSVPDYSGIELPEEYEADPVVAQMITQAQQTATTDALTHITTMLPDILAGMFKHYTSETRSEGDNLSMQQAVISEYEDPIYQRFAQDALARYMKAKPNGTQEEAKAAVKSAIDSLKPKPVASTITPQQNWGQN